MSARTIIAANLASAFLAGAWSLEGLVRRGAQACGGRFGWLRPLARRTLAAFPAAPRLPEVRTLRDFLLHDGGFGLAWADHCRRQENLLHRVYRAPNRMTPANGSPMSWGVPVLTTPAALADWLGLSTGELDWFADRQCRLRHAPPGPLHHYTYRWRPGRRKVRLLEVPKSRLKAIQRRLLHELLDPIPPHAAAHGFRRGHSLATYLAPHAGRQIVLHLDLRDFFPSLRGGRVYALFRTAGYPEDVARLLTGICTNSVPGEVLEAMPAISPYHPRPVVPWRLGFPHLPQGAPTSPALANLCAYRLDCRLAGLAHAVGASYTRYADDLVFSGEQELARSVRRFHLHVCRIALEEGFEVHTRKSHFMHQGVRQQVAGVVLNAHLNVNRREFDRLKAILTNCVRRGPEGQNRDGHADYRAHLAGRIAHVAHLHPARGRRLRLLFEQIRWNSATFRAD